MTSPIRSAAVTPVAATGDLQAQLLRALGRALVAVVIAATVAGGAAFGAGLLASASLPYFALGVGGALVACTFALLLHGRFLDPRTTAPFAKDGRLLATRLQSLLAAAFAVKLALLVLVVLVLRQLGTKFEDVATFAVTFAGGALLCQVVMAFVLARPSATGGAPRTGEPANARTASSESPAAGGRP